MEREETTAERLLRKLKGQNYAPRESQYRGIDFCTTSGKWRVRIYRLGNTFERLFESEEDAARVYDVASRIIFEKVPYDSLPSKCALRHPPNFDGNPPKGLARAEIRQWLHEAGIEF